jgi:hypothetical protein
VENLKAAQDEARKQNKLIDPPRCQIRADAINGIDETDNFNTDGRSATKIIHVPC